jgi:hypothetical protein
MYEHSKQVIVGMYMHVRAKNKEAYILLPKWLSKYKNASRTIFFVFWMSAFNKPEFVR